MSAGHEAIVSSLLKQLIDTLGTERSHVQADDGTVAQAYPDVMEVLGYAEDVSPPEVDEATAQDPLEGAEPYALVFEYHPATLDPIRARSSLIRCKELGSVVTLKDLLSCFPFDDALSRYTITGRNLKIYSHIM